MTERSSFGEDFLFDELSVSFDSSQSLFGSGMVLGNMRTRMETTRAREPKSRNPTHQAPIHRGSLGVIVVAWKFNRGKSIEQFLISKITKKYLRTILPFIMDEFLTIDTKSMKCGSFFKYQMYLSHFKENFVRTRV